ncbi:hypothetical protein L210DRAFT_499303 [Boletus edulis BED1]|uniref:Uncharacterized protein n=1 Tax=Boletus edulis BED1 TaxID=1328754 RepID=A0AAD4BQI4_BOLED|nr:hypothetical protein L210DRAFT_499303 [Boletus edulis BED1]
MRKANLPSVKSCHRAHLPQPHQNESCPSKIHRSRFPNRHQIQSHVYFEWTLIANGRENSWSGNKFYPRHNLQSRISPRYILFILAAYTDSDIVEFATRKRYESEGHRQLKSNLTDAVEEALKGP